MNVLFISKELNLTSGSGVGARMHKSALENIVGKENLYIVDMSVGSKPCREARYIAFGKYNSIYERLKRHLQGNIYLFSNSIICEICKLIDEKKIEVVFLDDSCWGNLVRKIKKYNNQIPVISFYHDVKAELYRKWIPREKWINKLDLILGLRGEKLNCKLVDKNIVLNRAENDLLKKYYTKEADYYLPVCVEQNNENVSNVYKENGKLHILFVGTAYYPNIQGIKWFISNVFKKIDDKFDLWIVGKGLECLRNDIKDENVHVVGFAESLASYYCYSDVVIAPLTDGGGMKIKTAEAIAYGKVFVGSSESLHGYYEEMDNSIKNKLIYKCDTSNEYIEALHKISNTGVKKKNTELIELYRNNYSPKAAEDIIRRILNETVRSID